MSMSNMVKLAEELVLPDGEFEDSSSVESDEADFNDLSPEALLAMVQGDCIVEESVVEEPQEATEDELRALLGDTLSVQELDGVENGYLEVAKGIEKLKLRKLANRIDEMAPQKMFPSHKDEVYYLLSSMAGQSPKLKIEDAEKKCSFIGESLGKLGTYMISEASFDMDEQEAMIELFDEFAKQAVADMGTRSLVLDQFKAGWRQVLKRLTRDILSLSEYEREEEKPIYVIYTFYESLSRAYSLCKAHDSIDICKDELSSQMNGGEKKAIVKAFEDVMDLAPSYGLRGLSFINRKQAYDDIEVLDIQAILKIIRKKRHL
jgi:hypothetical protein